MLDENYKTAIINLGAFLHREVNTAFVNAVAQIGKLFHVDQFAIDVHFFFKYSAGQRKNFVAVGEFTNVIAKNKFGKGSNNNHW